MKRSPRHLLAHRDGFTLLELLVSSTITIMLILVMVVAARTMMDSFNRDEGAIIRLGDASFAMDQIIQDLEGYVVPNNTLSAAASSTGLKAEGLKAEGLKATPETIQGLKQEDCVWLTLLTTATDQDNSKKDKVNPAPVNFPGATRAVSYRIALQNPIDGGNTEPVYALYRCISNARKTFDEAVGIIDAQTAYWPRVTPSPTHVSNFIAANVVRFHVRFLYMDETTGELVWTLPSDICRVGGNGATVGTREAAGGFRRAEVTMTILNQEGARRVATGMPVEDAITRYGQTFVRQTSFF